MSFICAVVAVPVWQYSSSVRRKNVPLFACESEDTADNITNTRNFVSWNKKKLALQLFVSSIWLVLKLVILPAFSALW